MDLDGLVRAARQGDERAWATLVDRFQDRALAGALGWSGRWPDAGDLAQEAFRLAYVHLDELREPAAFGAWFARLVRTACTRSIRPHRPVTVGLDDPGELLDRGASEPLDQLVAAEEAATVRAAIEALPAGERVVTALYYLADMSYPDIAAFLGIGLSAAKKRGMSARRHLKELWPVTADYLARSRPSQTGQLRDTVLLFSALHRRDVEAVRRLVAARPALAQATEDWTPKEAAQAEIGFSQRATALIRAAESGVVDIARLLLDAGAPVDGVCDCEGGESALWAACVAGLTDMVRFLLAAGADPNAAAFQGATPLHTAVVRRRHDIVPLLLEAGADPDRRDTHGRTPADWARRRPPGAPDRAGAWLWTGIRSLDLFAPIRRASLQWWPAGLGLGQFVVVAAISAALQPDETWYIGFEQPQVDTNSIRHGLEESAVPGRIHLARRGGTPAERRAHFGDAVTLVERRGRDHLVVVCLADEGHIHDIEVILPGLAADRRVLTTLVIEPFKVGATPAPGNAPPEGFDHQVVFDPRRAHHPSASLYPAIDPLLTCAREYPSAEHRDLAGRARQLLRWYDEVDPELRLPAPGAGAPAALRAAQELIRYLGQHIGLDEPFTSQPQELTGRAALMNEVSRLLPATGPNR